MSQITIHQGHTLDTLQRLPPDSIHCVVTSPPYWGLRDYGLEPLVWGGEPGCAHEWGEQIRTSWANSVPGQNNQPIKNTAAGHWKPKITAPFCRRCGAWLGSLGLEPTPELYLEHLVAIFREVRRVLRPDGTLWLNMGDSYNGSGGAGGDYGPGGLKEGQPKFPGRKFPHLKPKDLCGIPWRLALALQADGWWLRSDIIWSKPNPMPASVTDRPTTSHEYIFLLTKSAKYFYDQEAVKEQSTGQQGAAANFQRETKEHLLPGQNAKQHRTNRQPTADNGSRNLRTVWEIATEPFPEAHFATFPQRLVERCLKAGTSAKGCCPQCGAPWRRVVEKSGGSTGKDWNTHNRGNNDLIIGNTKNKKTTDGIYQVQTIGWQPTCKCLVAQASPPANLSPCTALDPFGGAGTTALIAAKMGLNAILCELKPEYVQMSTARLTRELGMLAQVEVIIP
jgi:DNA modification methylase